MKRESKKNLEAVGFCLTTKQHLADSSGTYRPLFSSFFSSDNVSSRKLVKKLAKNQQIKNLQSGILKDENRLGRSAEDGFFISLPGGGVCKEEFESCEHSHETDESKKVLSPIRSSAQKSLSFCLNLRRDGISLFSNKLKKSRQGITAFGKQFILVAVILISCSTGSAKEISRSYFNGSASWYSTECCRYNPHEGCPTASGKSLFLLEENSVDFAAMWGVPLGTKVRVTNLSNLKEVTVTIWDRGPAKRLHRVIDLSKNAFKKIADPKVGIITVKVEVLK